MALEHETNTWTETVEEPAPPKRQRACVVKGGSATLVESAPSPWVTRHLKGNWSCHINWAACWTTEARAQRIAEMAIVHLRQLEAEVAEMDATGNDLEAMVANIVGISRP